MASPAEQEKLERIYVSRPACSAAEISQPISHQLRFRSSPISAPPPPSSLLQLLPSPAQSISTPLSFSPSPPLPILDLPPKLGRSPTDKHQARNPFVVSRLRNPTSLSPSPFPSLFPSPLALFPCVINQNGSARRRNAPGLGGFQGVYRTRQVRGHLSVHRPLRPTQGEAGGAFALGRRGEFSFLKLFFRRFLRGTGRGLEGMAGWEGGDCCSRRVGERKGLIRISGREGAQRREGVGRGPTIKLKTAEGFPPSVKRDVLALRNIF